MNDYRLQAIKEFLITLLGDKRCLQIDGNVVYCEKMFMVNSVMKWLYASLIDDRINLDIMQKHLLIINDYLDNKVELFWNRGELEFVERETY